jgi:hypothetical protein
MKTNFAVVKLDVIKHPILEINSCWFGINAAITHVITAISKPYQNQFFIPDNLYWI